MKVSDERKASKSDRGTLKAELVRLGQTTSMKGISRAARTEEKLLRVMWLVAEGVGIGMALFLLSTVLSSYYSYGSVTRTSETLGSVPDFPDISICIVNPLGLDLGNGTFGLETYLHVTDHLMSRKLEKDGNHKLMQRYNWGEIKDELLSLSGYLQNVNLTAMGDKKTRIIVHCTWFNWHWSEKTEDCMQMVGEESFSPDYFLCNTIRLNKSMQEEQQVRGLTLLVYLDDNTEIQLPTFRGNLVHSTAKGVKVKIHSPGTMPDMKTGITAGPGSEVTFHLKPFKKTLLGEPFSSCNTTRDLSEMNYLFTTGTISDKKYTSTACQDLCRQDWVGKKCNCTNAHLLHFDEPILPYCASIHFHEVLAHFAAEHGPNAQAHNKIPFLFDFDKDLIELNCSLHEADRKEQCESQCSTPCQAIKYDFDLTHSDWPHPSYYSALYEYFKSHMPGSTLQKILDPKTEKNQPFSSSDMKQIKHNFVQLNFYTKQKIAVDVRETEAIPASTLMANIGGTMNLWAGVTFYTLCELFELLYYILKDLCRRGFGGCGAGNRENAREQR